MFYVNTKHQNKLPFIILGVLLSIDLLFISAHILIVSYYNFKPTYLLLHARGLGYPECFQYFKYTAIMVLTIYLYQLKKWNLYKLLFILFLCFLIDDVFQLHQFASGFISNILKLNFKFNDMALGVGQLIYTLMIVILLLGTSLWYYKLSSVLTQKAFLNIFLLLSFFLFFGIGVDVLHAFFKAQGQVSTVLTIIEEGGEMLTLSILVWYFCNSVVKHRVV